MATPAGCNSINEINQLDVPTTPKGGIEDKEHYFDFPNPPNGAPPDEPESTNRLLDIWLSGNDPYAWIEALGDD